MGLTRFYFDYSGRHRPAGPDLRSVGLLPGRRLLPQLRRRLQGAVPGRDADGQRRPRKYGAGRGAVVRRWGRDASLNEEGLPRLRIWLKTTTDAVVVILY